jgi:hypothetical protein
VNIRGVLKDIEALLPKATTQHLRLMLRGLKKDFSKIKDKEIAIISD